MLDYQILVPTAVLIVAVILDIVTAKFPNWLFIICVAVGGIWLYSQTNMEGFMKGFLAAILVFIILAPLVFLGVLGAGDIKLLSAFTLFTSWQTVASLFIYALFWGLLVGLIKLILSGEIKNLSTNLISRKKSSSGRIPFTVAILLGWLSYLTIGGI